jgi:hypothetical protein
MAKKESVIDIFIRYEGGKLRIEAPMEFYPLEVKEIMEKANTMVGQYLYEIVNGKKPTQVKGALKLVKMKPIISDFPHN